MKTRIITGVVGVALLVAVLFFLPPIALNIAVAALAVLAMREVLPVTGMVTERCMIGWCMVYAAACPFLQMLPGALLAATILFAIGLCVMSVLRHEHLRVDQTGFAFLMATGVSFALSSLCYLRAMPHGLLYVLLALVIPWTSDTGAYFTGVAFGKHKLCPVVSPQKTVEGLIGGMLISVACAVLTVRLYSRFAAPTAEVNWVLLAVIAAVLAPLSVFGDLFASLIKRQAGVKDYGNIFPGHGGVMDRFDSVLPVAPLLYGLLQWVTLVA